MIHRDEATKPAWPAPGFALTMALAAWLGAAPATAQAPASQAPAVRGAESGEAPKENVTERVELFIVGSSTMKPYVALTVAEMQRDYQLAPPKLHLQGSNKGIAEFCDGVGVDYPDIVVSSRAMHKNELDDCIQNGILDVIEIQIGQSALFVVTDKEDAGKGIFDVTPRMLYLALAAEVPKGGGFEENTARTWRQVDKSAPDLPIHVILPERSSGTRSSFDATFMQGGCRRIKEIDFIYSAAERTHRCITLRTDGVVTEIPEPYGAEMVEKLLEAPPGTIAVMAGEIFVSVRAMLDPLPVGGVLPSFETVSRFEYLAASGYYFYFKRAHMRNKAGVGVVRGIREFMAVLTHDDLMGREGAFAQHGLITLTDREIQGERRKAKTLQRLKK